MFSSRQRIASYLQSAIEEIELVGEMSKPIQTPDDFGQSMTGMTIFRACGMSLQYITENFTKIRNLTKESFFSSYKQVPWKSVFGMRNFLVHEYAEVDDEAIFRTIKKDLPVLKEVSENILRDLNSGKLDDLIKNAGF